MLASHTVYSPWGNIAPPFSNDNTPPPAKPLMIGLTGKRNVGKSTVAALLEKEYAFTRVHAFESGKEASVEFFRAIGADEPWEMVYGDLKDKPSEFLPGEVAPRYFLEKFGHFMGHTMGVEWTLALEIAKARRAKPGRLIVVESLVYEAGWFRAQGGLVVRLERPGHDGPAGIESDAVQARVAADRTISARTVEDLQAQTRMMVQQVFGGG